MNEMSFNSINPFIRFSRKFYGSYKDIYQVPVIAYDCRLFFCVDGHGALLVDGNTYDLIPGSLLMFPSNTVYHYLPCVDESMFLYAWNFDFTHNFSNITIPIPSEYAESFNPKNILENIHFTDATIFNSVIYLRNMFELKTLISDINNEFNLKHNFSDLRCSALATEVLVHIYKASALSQNNSSQNSVVLDIVEYINKNYMQELSNSKIGKIFGYNPNYINHLFTKHTGLSLHQYVLNTRISQAIRMLMDTALPFNDISALLGFKDYSHFLKCFKKATNMTPKQFRK